jgi:DNA polymerase
MDFETYSEAGFEWQQPDEKYPLGRWVAPLGAKDPGIGAVGAPAYSQHPTTEVLTLSYDLCDGRGIRRWRPGQPLPYDLFEHIARGGLIEAHNAMFERMICENVCVPKYGWPIFPADAWRCSMATAIVAQRPGALAPLAEVLGLSEQKDKEGTRLIKKFSIPQQPIVGLVDKKTGRVKRADQPARRIYPHDDPDDFEKFCAYCDQDVRTEMAAMERLPALEPHEVAAWQMTQAMNYRGLGVDKVGLESCMVILAQIIDRYGRECEEITGLKVTQLEKMKGWLAAYGVHTSSLDADAIAALLKRDDLHPTARRVLELRERTGSASVKKMFAIKNRLSTDGRLRDIMVHHGTRPGRPTGEGPQPLNLPKAGPKLSWCSCGRPAKHVPVCPWCGSIKPAAAKTKWESAMVDHVLEIMLLESLDMVETFFGDAMVALQGCVRGLFEAGPGNELVSTDYSSLQAVVAACLAGETWKIDVFRNKGPVYLMAASKITGRPVEEYLEHAAQTGDHHPDRQAGKTAELALGFQGWINAWKAMEDQQGVQSGYDDQRLKEIILAWRKANPAIVEMWGGQWRGSPWRRERQELYGLEGMFIAAVQQPGEYFEYRGVGFCMEEKDCLVIRLPQIDGVRRALRYHEPMLAPSQRNADELSISYMTYNTNPTYGARGWVRMPTWGGRIFENVVMGVEVDIQRFGARLLATYGYDMVLGVYDEDVCEIPKGKPLLLGLPPVEGLDPYVQEIEHLLAIMPREISDWPIRAADGWRGRRYRKG